MREENKRSTASAAAMAKKRTYSENTSEVAIKETSRIISGIDYFGNQMICLKCQSVLSLLDKVRETERGLHFTLFIKCLNCRRVQEVHSGPEHASLKSSWDVPDVNTKMVLGKKLHLLKTF